jgi:spore coat polysaccharide biosynthesis protein SpsF
MCEGTIIVIQSRINSTRLPGKAMMPLSGKPLTWHIIERLNHVKFPHKKVLAIPHECDNKPLKDIAASTGIEYLEGEVEDVLARFIQVADKYKPQTIVRVTGDNPLIEPFCIDLMLEYHVQKDCEYTAVTGLPLGTGGEAIKTSTLRQVDAITKGNAYHREHVTTYIREHRGEFDARWIDAPPVFLFPNMHLTVDTIVNFRLMENLYDTFYTPGNIVDLKQVISYLSQ